MTSHAPYCDAERIQKDSSNEQKINPNNRSPEWLRIGINLGLDSSKRSQLAHEILQDESKIVSILNFFLIMSSSIFLGKYLTLEDFCTCSKTYQKYAELIDPYPKNSKETIAALQALNHFILDPIIDYFGIEQFQLTYGFCSASLKRYLNQKDPVTGLKNGRVDPSRDQHIAHEINRNGNYYCRRFGAACDFIIKNQETNQIIEWILQAKLPFDSLYFYGNDRPLHISYGPQHKREIWTFTPAGMPTQKGIESWIKLAKHP